MKKQILGATIMLSVMLMATSVMALNPAPYNGLNKGNVQHLYLFEKDSNWDIVDDGAWGKLTINKGFVFNGHGLEANTDYTLLRYTEWSSPVTCLDSGVSDKKGNVHLSGAFNDGGEKVWLVLSDDVDCQAGMTGWNPSEYLFEYNLI